MATPIGQMSGSRGMVGLALACGLLLRVGCLGGVEYHFDRGDAASYRSTALTLLDHGTYSFSESEPFEPSAYRPPGYTAFVAFVSSVSRSTIALQLAQIALSMVAVLGLWLVARRAIPQAAVIALWLAAFNPFDAAYAGAGLSESVTSTMFVAAAAAVTFLRGTKRALAVGVCLGLLCLLRDIYLALIPFGALGYVVVGHKALLGARLRQGVLTGVVAACVIAPWTIRNWVHFHRVIPVSAGRLGYSLWMGTWAVDGSFTTNDAVERTYPASAFLSDADREEVRLAGADIARSEPVFKRLARERVAAEPFKVLGRWLVRWPRLWLGTRFDIFELNSTLAPAGTWRWTALKIAFWSVNALFCVAALIGAALALRGRQAVAWAVVPVLFTALVYLPLNSFENRYSQPMFPFVTLFAAVSLERGLRMLFRRSHQP